MKARPAAALTAPTDAAGPAIRDKIAFYGAGWQIHAEDLAGYIAGRERGRDRGAVGRACAAIPGTGGQRQFAGLAHASSAPAHAPVGRRGCEPVLEWNRYAVARGDRRGARRL